MSYVIFCYSTAAPLDSLVMNTYIQAMAALSAQCHHRCWIAMILIIFDVFSPFEVAVFASSPCLGKFTSALRTRSRVPCPSALLVALARSSGGILATYYAPHYASLAADIFRGFVFRIDNGQRPTVIPPRVSFSPIASARNEL